MLLSALLMGEIFSWRPLQLLGAVLTCAASGAYSWLRMNRQRQLAMSSELEAAWHSKDSEHMAAMLFSSAT